MPTLGSTGFNKTMFFILLVATLSAIAMTYYKFYIVRAYPFIVQASCNGAEEGCVTDGDSFYKEYEILAKDYDQCLDGTCKYECENGIISCTIFQKK